MKPLYIVSVIDLKNSQKTNFAIYETFQQAKLRQKIWNEMFTKDNIQKLACIEITPYFENNDKEDF